MRHATDDDLDRLEGVLRDLRAVPSLREQARGRFSRGGKAFVHFHEDAGELFADVRLEARFERMRVTSEEDRAVFIEAVRQALRPG